LSGGFWETKSLALAGLQTLYCPPANLRYVVVGGGGGGGGGVAVFAAVVVLVLVVGSC
jgi:hypothetical protein